METKSESRNPRVLLAGLALVFTANLASAQEPAGVVRISDRSVNPVSFSDTNDWCQDESAYFIHRNKQVVRKIKHGLVRPGCLNECDKHFVRPPVGIRVPARGMPYQQYWSDAWRGQPATPMVAQFPMVYQPTDTTQLGYYHTHVPTWSYRPGILPPAPVPHWPLATCRGNCFTGGYHGGGHGGWVMESAVDVTPQPTAQPTEEGTLVPEPEANLPRRID